MKPCPFCGSDEIDVRREDYNFFGANCRNCGSEGSFSETREEAIKAWNERAPQPDLLEACVYALNAAEEAIERVLVDWGDVAKKLETAIAKARE